MNPNQMTRDAWRKKRQAEDARDRSGLARVPSRFAGGGTSFKRIVIGGSNTDTVSGATMNWYGVKNPSAPVSSVPTPAPADIATTIYTDGLCAGMDIESGALVWIATYVEYTPPGGSLTQRYASLWQRLPYGLRVTAADSVLLPCGATTATVWLPSSYDP